MIPQFIRFYGYSNSDTLNEYATAFFSLVNSMYEIKAKEMLDDISVLSVANSKDNGASVISALKKQYAGLGGIVKEVKTAMQSRKNR